MVPIKPHSNCPPEAFLLTVLVHPLNSLLQTKELDFVLRQMFLRSFFRFLRTHGEKVPILLPVLSTVQHVLAPALGSMSCS